jgi:hypothetical protein
MTNEERRKQPRVDSHNLLSFVCLDGKNYACGEGLGRTLDVSRGGILLETHEPLDPRHTILLTISLKDDLITLKGRVAHQRPCGDGKYNYGITFTKLDKKAEEVLDRFIETFRRSNSPPR